MTASNQTRFKKSPPGGPLHNLAGRDTECLCVGDNRDEVDDDAAEDASADDADDGLGF